ncbi:MAG TPA: hypothetical protein VFW71_08440 [Actinomycetota bacterium]|nr:hypothetical protein [Actinomycetota bacterium]
MRGPAVAAGCRAVRRPGTAGLAVAAAYLLVAAATFALHLLPGFPILDDGAGAPPPYQWVHPPPARAGNNVLPQAASMALPISGGSVNTPEGQCQVLLEAGSVPAAAGQTGVSITMTPLDPATVGPPPSGLTYDSNAYQIAAAYQPSGEPLPASVTATVVLSYAALATTVYRRDGAVWTGLSSTPASSDQLFASTTGLGVFVVAAAPSAVAGGGSATVLGIGGAFLVLVAIAAVALTRRRGHASR